MAFSVKQYVPILKWRMGEYQALLRLDDAAKDQIVPLIVIPPVEFDFEEQRDKKTVEEHIAPFARRFGQKWGDRRAFIDLHQSLETATRDSGQMLAASVFEELRESSANAIPVFKIGQSRGNLLHIKSTNDIDKKGACLRISLSDLTDPAFSAKLSAALTVTEMKRSALDLVVDLEAPKNFQPYDDFAAIITNLLPLIGQTDQYRSFAVAATGFPEAMAMFKPGGSFPRHEWHLYLQLVSELSEGGRVPTFSDYGTERPEFLSLDMRLIKPAGKVVYTTSTDWLVRKGGAFRDDPAQMRNHCRDIIASGLFRGESFSFGDKFIKKCGDLGGSTSSLTMWKTVSMNNHMTQVVEDLAKLHGA